MTKSICHLYFVIHDAFFCLKDLSQYELDPEGYMQQTHNWFTANEVKMRRLEARRHWDVLL